MATTTTATPADKPAPGKARVKLRATLADSYRSMEIGEIVEVPLADARRMVFRGLAAEVPEHPLPKATEAEARAASLLHVETAGPAPKLGRDGKQCRSKRTGEPLFHNSNRVLVRPVAPPREADEDDDD